MKKSGGMTMKVKELLLKNKVATWAMFTTVVIACAFVFLSIANKPKSSQKTYSGRARVVRCVKSKLIIEPKDFDDLGYRDPDYECKCFVLFEGIPGFMVATLSVIPGGADGVENGKKVHYPNIVEQLNGHDIDESCRPVYDE